MEYKFVYQLFFKTGYHIVLLDLLLDAIYMAKEKPTANSSIIE